MRFMEHRVIYTAKNSKQLPPIKLAKVNLWQCFWPWVWREIFRNAIGLVLR